MNFIQQYQQAQSLQESQSEAWGEDDLRVDLLVRQIEFCDVITSQQNRSVDASRAK